MLTGHVVRPSNSEWSFQVVLVPKAGGWRFCINYKPLNNITYRDQYPLPRIDDVLHQNLMAGPPNTRSMVFSTLDLAAGYWQIPLRECDKPKTAFTVPDRGLFEFNVLPFGLTNAPATFQRLIEEVLRPALHKSAEGYIDDIGIYSPSWAQHLIDLRVVLGRLREFRLSLKGTKCNFGARVVKFLGHEISSDGIVPNQDKCDAIRLYPTPKMQRTLEPS